MLLAEDMHHSSDSSGMQMSMSWAALKPANRQVFWVFCAACTLHLAWLFWSEYGGGREESQASLRSAGYPQTYIARIHLDLTAPNHWVRLTWAGPLAAQQDAGPYRSSPGAGWGDNDCNDPVESNCPDSRCTPKGLRKVEDLRDHMADNAQLRFVTVIDQRRAIAFHSHPVVPPFAASKGCVRLESYAAQLIHDNSKVGITEILIDGTWSEPRLKLEQDNSPTRSQATVAAEK